MSQQYKPETPVDLPEQDLVEIWTSGFVLGSVTMLTLVAFVGYKAYQHRFHINYKLLLRRRRLMERRDPEMDFTYDVFISYSQVIKIVSS